jgi:serine/threonine protein kinase
LVHQNTIKLANFGHSHRLTEVTSTQRDIFGLIPYIDPQLFCNNYNYKKLDVYSVGVLLWEISSGKRPFESYNNNYYQKITLISEILDGKREAPVLDTPIDYVNIYTSMTICCVI